MNKLNNYYKSALKAIVIGASCFFLSSCIIFISSSDGGKVHHGAEDGPLCDPNCELDTAGADSDSYHAVADSGFQFDHWQGNAVIYCEVFLFCSIDGPVITFYQYALNNEILDAFGLNAQAVFVEAEPEPIVEGLVGPHHYVSLDDSPFAPLNLANWQFEDFEDDTVDLTGAAITGSGIMFSSGFGNPTNIDSVDSDDGVINGTNNDGEGNYGDAYWAYGQPGFTITFDEEILGDLPTHVGVVWTDGDGSIYFEAKDSIGNTIAESGPDDTACCGHGGQTEDDYFYGVYHNAGVASIHIWNTSGGIEIDHLQFGGTAVR